MLGHSFISVMPMIPKDGAARRRLRPREHPARQDHRQEQGLAVRPRGDAGSHLLQASDSGLEKLSLFLLDPRVLSSLCLKLHG